MEFFKRKKIGLFGSADGCELERNTHLAMRIGAKIAQSGSILCTGACYGLPHEAALGAEINNGLVLGFSPAINLGEHIELGLPVKPYYLIFTGMGQEGRSLICTRTCDAAIFIAGRWGTMIEFSLMCDEGKGKVIGLLGGSGGFVDSCFITALEESEKIPKAVVIARKDSMAMELIDEMLKVLDSFV